MKKSVLMITLILSDDKLFPNSLKKRDEKNMLGQISTAWAWPWYTVMVLINVAGLVYCAFVYKRSLVPRDGKDLVYRRWMRIMGVIFAVVSAYRAISVWAVPYTFRGPNTFAEVSFAGLFAYAMLRFNKYLPASESARAPKLNSFLKQTPYILVGCLVVAQPIDTWGGVTHFALRGVFVETLWGLGFLSVLPLAIIQLRRVSSIKDTAGKARFRLMKYSSIIIATWCVVYCMYRWIFTLPGMWVRAFNTLEAGLPPIETGLQAIIDALGIRTQTSLEYRDWSFTFLIWHSAYFSICTWISIFLMKAPRPLEVSGEHDAKLSFITLGLIAIGLITLITLIGLPADLDEILILIVLGGLFLVPIVYISLLELKGAKLKTTE